MITAFQPAAGVDGASRRDQRRMWVTNSTGILRTIGRFRGKVEERRGPDSPACSACPLYPPPSSPSAAVFHSSKVFEQVFTGGGPHWSIGVPSLSSRATSSGPH